MSTWLGFTIKPDTKLVNGLTVIRDPYERQPEVELNIVTVEGDDASVDLNYSEAETLRDQLNHYLGHNDPNQGDDGDRRVANVGVYLKSLSTEGEKF